MIFMACPTSTSMNWRPCWKYPTGLRRSPQYGPGDDSHFFPLPTVKPVRNPGRFLNEQPVTPFRLHPSPLHRTQKRLVRPSKPLRRTVLAAPAAGALTALALPAQACTSFRLQSQGGTWIAARSMEFGWISRVLTVYELVLPQAGPLATAAEGTNLALHILNAVDIPLGTVAERTASKTGGAPTLTYDKTEWTTVYDLQHRIPNFRTYGDQTIRKVDLTKVDFGGKAIQHLPMPDDLAGPGRDADGRLVTGGDFRSPVVTPVRRRGWPGSGRSRWHWWHSWSGRRRGGRARATCAGSWLTQWIPWRGKRSCPSG